MNLYKSFGNLMEAWITEGGQCRCTEFLGKNDEDSTASSSHMETNLRSESVDSGVELASSDMSFHGISSSVSTENTDIDTFAAEREGEKSTPASESSVLSCPTPSSVFPSTTQLNSGQEALTILHQKVEQTLQRTNSKHLKKKTEFLMVDDMLRRHPQPCSLPKRHTSEIVRNQRRTLDPSAPHRRRRPMSMLSDKVPSQRKLEDLNEEEGKGLSPGLCYLEQVCQMLEEIAKRQMHNQALQRETDALGKHKEAGLNQTLDGCQTDSPAADDNVFSCQRLKKGESVKHSPSELRRRNDYRRHFRQRSASDADIATLHLRMLDADCRGQLSTEDLLDKLKDDFKKQGSKGEKTKTVSHNWKFKIGSLRRESYNLREMEGQKMQSSERNSVRLWLSQLFKRNRKKVVSE